MEKIAHHNLIGQESYLLEHNLKHWLRLSIEHLLLFDIF